MQDQFLFTFQVAGDFKGSYLLLLVLLRLLLKSLLGNISIRMPPCRRGIAFKDGLGRKIDRLGENGHTVPAQRVQSGVN